jgi:hypothetical protein
VLAIIGLLFKMTALTFGSFITEAFFDLSFNELVVTRSMENLHGFIYICSKHIEFT